MRRPMVYGLTFFIFSCQATVEESVEPELIEDLSNIIETEQVPYSFAPNPFTYEGNEYDVLAVSSSIVPETDSMISTLVTLVPTKSLEVSIELRYYLYEGKHESTDWTNTSDSGYVEVIFNEAFYGELTSYTTNMPPEVPIDYGSPGCTITISNIKSNSWDIHFGAGAENLEEKAAGHYGRCGTGYLTGVTLGELPV